MSTDLVINPAEWGGGVLARTVKANYAKMGERNFLFTERNNFRASGVMTEYS